MKLQLSVIYRGTCHAGEAVDACMKPNTSFGGCATQKKFCGANAMKYCLIEKMPQTQCACPVHTRTSQHDSNQWILGLFCCSLLQDFSPIVIGKSLATMKVV
jgi:hypothetical protein